MRMEPTFKTTKSGIIFDFDYTLVDSSEVIYHCVNEALARMHYGPVSQEQVQTIIADSLEDAYLKLTGDEDPDQAQVYAAHVRDIQANLTDFKTKFFEGVHDELVGLHDQGIKLGIVSTNDKVNIDRFLKREGAAKLFDSIMSATEVSVYKPHPQGLYQCLKQLDKTQQDVIFLGDSVHDAGAAKNANVDFMGVLTGQASENCFQAYPHLSIHDNAVQGIQHINDKHL